MSNSLVNYPRGSTIVSNNAGISACEKGEQWERALALLSEMWEVKLQPDTLSSTIPGAASERSEQ